MSGGDGIADTVEMPMFPLGSVLFPGGVLPLHIFEIRYQQLLNRALETDRRFGVVLISRGSEVGGGDTRTDVGTIARIDESQRFDDGRAALVCTGMRRCDVVEWLPDDPYPRALVRALDDDADGPDDRALLAGVRRSFDELMQLAARLGRVDTVPQVEWVTDVEAATWQLADLVPCSAHDQQSILSAGSRATRLARVDALLREKTADLELLGGSQGSA